MVVIQYLLWGGLIVLVAAAVIACVYLIILLLEFIRAARSVNRLLDSTENEVNAMVKDVSKTVNVTSVGVRDLVERIRFFTGFLEVLGVFSSSMDVVRGSTKKATLSSKIALVSALAGIKKFIEVLLSDKSAK
jgi:hypothetical protein